MLIKQKLLDFEVEYDTETRKCSMNVADGYNLSNIEIVEIFDKLKLIDSVNKNLRGCIK